MLKLISRTRDFAAFLRAGELVRSRNFNEAQEIADVLAAKSPKAPAYKLLQADILMFQGNLTEALDAFEKVQDLISETRFSAADRRFLNAYVNFRKMGIEYEQGVRAFDGWEALAKMINGFPAKKLFKDVFKLPEE